MAVGESTRFGTLNKYANFASSLPMSGERTVITLTPFLLEENRRHGPERLRVNGRQLVWRMRYRNMLGAEKASLRIRPS
jgi:hypothetical protein